MAKVQIKSEELTSFGGIFPIMEKFERLVSPIIDKALGIQCIAFGYQYSEIIRSLACVYFCSGSCVEGTYFRQHHVCFKLRQTLSF